MEQTVSDQLRQLVAALVTGGTAGLFFDILGCFSRGAQRRNKLLQIMAAAASAMLVFVIARASGAGTRLFFLLAVSGGSCLYLWALHGMVCSAVTVMKHYLQYYTLTVLRSAVLSVKTKIKNNN